MMKKDIDLLYPETEATDSPTPKANSNSIVRV